MSTERRAIVIQHVAAEGPGTIADALRARGIGLDLVRVDRDEAMPKKTGDAAALVVMGGPRGVYEADRHPHLKAEMALINTALRAECPVLGICLGSQLVAAALGARVAPAPRKEIGWYDVTLREAAREDPMWQGLGPTFTAFHWHGDVFDLPRDAVSLASSDLTQHQAFRHGENVYGLLFHLEVGRQQVEVMSRTFADDARSAGVEPESLIEQSLLQLPHVERLAGVVFTRWAARLAHGPTAGD